MSLDWSQWLAVETSLRQPVSKSRPYGVQYTMGKLAIVGLDLNGEAEIARIWTLKEGKTLNPEYPDYFLNRIKEEGLFEGLGATKADLKVDAQKHTADVTLTFAGEDPTKQPGRRGGRGGER